MRFPALPALLLACVAATVLPARGQEEVPPVPVPLPPIQVRLASLGTPSRIIVRAPIPLRVVDPASGAVYSHREGGLAVIASGGTVKAGTLQAARLRLEGAQMTVQVGKLTRTYPEALLVSAGKNGLTLVNECDLERYTEGVLCGECPALFHPEAIRAMAVAARSYSYRKAYLGGELCDTTHCQVYPGIGGLKPSIREAVQATTGLCALYDGEVIDAVYSADCGGYTEANEVAWKGARPIPYLRPVEDAPEPNGEPFCSVNRNHKWSFTLAKTRLLELLGKAERSVKLAILEQSESGRVRRLQLASDAEGGAGMLAEREAKSNRARLFSGDEWRRLLGLEKVRSLKFEVVETETGIQLSGRGYGHGVGLCQFGANGMGKQGYTFTDIIQHYYTGVTLAAAPSVQEARARLAQKKMAARSRPPAGGE
jgi:stage II sporulation protein D